MTSLENLSTIQSAKRDLSTHRTNQHAKPARSFKKNRAWMEYVCVPLVARRVSLEVARVPPGHGERHVRQVDIDVFGLHCTLCRVRVAGLACLGFGGGGCSGGTG